MMVWRPVMHEQTRVYGSFFLGGTLNPLRKDNITEDPEAKREIDNPVSGQFMSYFAGGIQLLDRISAGFMLPVFWLQKTGTDPAEHDIGYGGLDDANTALGDLRLDLRGRLFEDPTETIRIGMGIAFFAPTGDQEAYASDDGSPLYLYGAGEIDFGGFILSGNIGPHWRPDRSIPGDNSVLFVADELRYAFGAYLPLRDGRVRLGGELWGTFGIGEGVPPGGAQGESAAGNSNNFALEWMGQTRLALSDDQRLYMNIAGGTRLSNGYGAADIRLLASVGYSWGINDEGATSPAKKIEIVPDADDYDKDTDKDGYPDNIDKCPTVKEDGLPPDPSDGCPAPPDRDKDGIFDADDKCPDEPEDKDGIQDDDGCPEVDIDNDGIPDTEDACPHEPGPRSEVPEKNGCPGLTKFEEDGSITLLEPIQFEYNRATIKPVSYPILDEVVILMKARPEIAIGVYGHSDNKGGKAYNLKLSQARAAACLDYLVKHGVEQKRLQSEGYGPDKPVADNATEEGRAKNRRVEFKVVEGLDGEESEDATDAAPEGAGEGAAEGDE
jgi:outer membrane protein OmpA-like peptidoglycan-associated protein